MAKHITPGQAAEQVKEGASRVTDEDVERVVERADEIEMKASKGPLGRFIRDVRLMIALVRDYWNGSYRQIPWWAIAAVVAALIYVLSPIDLIPDFIPVIGLTDDAAVVAACLLMVERQLADYEAWKKSQG